MLFLAKIEHHGLSRFIPANVQQAKIHYQFILARRCERCVMTATAARAMYELHSEDDVTSKDEWLMQAYQAGCARSAFELGRLAWMKNQRAQALQHFDGALSWDDDVDIVNDIFILLEAVNALRDVNLLPFTMRVILQYIGHDKLKPAKAVLVELQDPDMLHLFAAWDKVIVTIEHHAAVDKDMLRRLAAETLEVLQEACKPKRLKFGK
jgi:hypothetical protein